MARAINFMRYRPAYALFSALIFLTFAGTLVYKHAKYGRTFVYSVDFTGGTQVHLSFSKPVTAEEVVSSLKDAALGTPEARVFSEKEMLVRVGAEAHGTGDTKDVADRLVNTLQQKLPDVTVQALQVESVGAGVGAALWWKALQALIVGLIAMLLYTWLRFWSFAFGAGVLVSLIHDAVVILTFFLLFDYEISLNVVGAVLAILGYSINDTIVIFSRIRENIHRLRGTSLVDVVNISTNETLRRTLLTSFATLLVVLALLLFGGETLRTLSLALFVGIVFGTYSSIAMATPVMLLLQRKRA
jgi:preprotein translocase subunit SecF